MISVKKLYKTFNGVIVLNDISTEFENGKTNLPIELEKAECVVTIGDDLGKCFGIKINIIITDLI